MPSASCSSFSTAVLKGGDVWVRFADPDQSWVVLVGTGSYSRPDLPGLPAVVNNLSDFRAVLTDPQLGGLHPEHCIVIPDPSALPALGVELARVANQTKDTLIVYYAGHGLLDDRGGLFLALRDTDPDHVAFTALPFAWVREAIADSPARNRILILDCCFSGRAIEAMATSSALVSGQIEIAGAYTLTSAPANEPARAPADARHTAFTAELLNILQCGIENDHEGLSLGEIYLELRRAHLARGLPSPQQRTTATVDRFALVRNAVHVGGQLSGQPGIELALRSASVSSGLDGTLLPAQDAVSLAPTPTPASAPPWAAGVAAWRAGDLEGARRIMSHAVESAAGSHASASASITLGLLYRDGYRDLDTSETLLARAIGSDDAELAALARLHFGCVAELRGNTRGAADEYRQAIGGPDADCAALAAARLGWLLADEDRTGEAEQAFRAGRDRGGSRVEAWIALGLADTLVRSGRSGEAADMYEEALASDDGKARAFAALGARRLCLESELMAEAAEYARSVAENPAVTSLWPVVLADEKPSTPEGRIYAISKWLTWLRSGDGEYACLADRANPGQVILFENPGSMSMSVLVVPRALPRRRRGEAKEIFRELAIMGFEIEDREDDPLASDTESWTINAQDKTDHDLAVLSEEIMTSLLIGRPDFTLKVDFEPTITHDPQPRPPLPDLLPR